MFANIYDFYSGFVFPPICHSDADDDVRSVSAEIILPVIEVACNVFQVRSPPLRCIESSYD
jgi:hypothetical protein